jgi:hypothetical protein
VEFTDVKVLVVPNDGITVQWRIVPQDVDLNTVEVHVERSGGPEGPWSELTVVDPNSVFIYKDVTGPQRADRMGLYFRLLAKDRQTQAVVEASDPFTDTRVIPLYALEIRRQVRIYLEGVNNHRGYVGNACTIYKLRTFGPKCMVCRDASSDRIVISNCRECGGTGQAGDGYFNPVDVFCKVDPEQKELGFGPLMKTDDRHTRVMMLDVPILYPGDVIVERSEKHWRVVNVDPAEDNERNPVIQFPTVVEIDRADVVYSKLRHSQNGGLRP